MNFMPEWYLKQKTYKKNKIKKVICIFLFFINIFIFFNVQYLKIKDEQIINKINNLKTNKNDREKNYSIYKNLKVILECKNELEKYNINLINGEFKDNSICLIFGCENDFYLKLLNVLKKNKNIKIKEIINNKHTNYFESKVSLEIK